MLLDLNLNATSRLGLEPVKDKTGKFLYRACVPALVQDVRVDYQNHDKGEFAGMKVPVLAIDFSNIKLNADDPDRFLTHYAKPVGTKVKDGDNYKDREVADVINDNVDLWKLIKHFLESLTGSPNYRSLASIPKADIQKYFVLPELDTPDKRLAQYELFFNYIVDFIKGNATLKSMIVDKDGNTLPLWLKLTPNYDSDPKRKAKFYSISRYVGQGVFEPLVSDKSILKDPKVIKADNVDMTLNTASTVTTGASGAGAPGAGAGYESMAPEVKKALGLA
jgi:hypothetical protein